MNLVFELHMFRQHTHVDCCRVSDRLCRLVKPIIGLLPIIDPGLEEVQQDTIVHLLVIHQLQVITGPDHVGRSEVQGNSPNASALRLQRRHRPPRPQVAFHIGNGCRSRIKLMREKLPHHILFTSCPLGYRSWKLLAATANL